jgi:hypothetical protein
MINYKNKDILIATKHGKETVIAPAFLTALNCHIQTTDDFDTDIFGTFSGEIKRELSAKETCIAKAKTAANRYGFRYAIANEGSFGPDPIMPFVPCNIEIMSFIDLENGFTITEQMVSNNTNYNHLAIDKNTQYQDFLTKIDFPKHGLMLRNLADDQIIDKGITDSKVLFTIIKKHLKMNQQLRLETDMRAMLNPTRMKNIAQLANALAKKVSTHCPHCEIPGFGSVRPFEKLDCELCGQQTRLYRLQQTYCEHCDYSENHPRPDGKLAAPADYCDYCNP